MILSNQVNITKAELAALFPYQSDNVEFLETIRTRVFKRCTLIFLIFVIRSLLATYYPQYHVSASFTERFVDIEAPLWLTQVKLIPTAFCSLIYLYSMYKNIYFKFANVAAVFIFCGLIWKDIEILLLVHSLSNSIIPFLGVIGLRLLIVMLLVRNYLDTK